MIFESIEDELQTTLDKKTVSFLKEKSHIRDIGMHFYFKQTILSIDGHFPHTVGKMEVLRSSPCGKCYDAGINKYFKKQGDKFVNVSFEYGEFIEKD